MRYREVEADFSSTYGEPVFQTHLQFLEMLAASLYTREIFKLFRPVLNRSSTCNVVGVRQSTAGFIYIVSRYCKKHIDWRVSFCQSSLVFKCSCERFESLSIPCEHLITVLVYLHIVQLPECLVLKR